MAVDPSTIPAVRERERGFALRAARLVGVDPALVRDVIAEETRDANGVGGRLVRLEVVKWITEEEALRLRYGEDAVIARTEQGGWTVTFPAFELSPDVPLVP